MNLDDFAAVISVVSERRQAKALNHLLTALMMRRKEVIDERWLELELGAVWQMVAPSLEMVKEEGK